MYTKFISTKVRVTAVMTENTAHVACGTDPKTIYMVTSGTQNVNGGCCFDYGNSENDCTNPKACFKGY